MFQLIPLAAGEIVGLIVFIITVISWIFNIVSQYSQQQQQRQAANLAKPKPATPRPESSQTRREVDDFIQRQRLEKKRKRAQERNEPARPPNRPGARPESAKAGGGRSGGPPPLPVEDDSARRPVGGAIANRHVQTSDLGAGVRQSVREHLVDTSLSKTVARDMQPQVSASVQAHLGAFSGDSATRSGTGSNVAPVLSPSAAVSQSAQSLIQLFRDPVTLRQSMIVNLVLTKPVAMTRRSLGDGA
jgi:hypothetical protein